MRNNQLTKLEISGENITELIAGQNHLESLNLASCPKIKRLIVCDNSLLGELGGLNLAGVKEINVSNTLVNLAQENEELKAAKEEALKAIKTLKEAAEEKEFVLTEAIQTPKQAEEAILRHLKKTGEKWLSHLKNGDNPVLSIRLNSLERKKHFKDVLKEISETQTHHNYQQLAQKWSKINDYQELVRKWKDDEDYGIEYDFDGSLDSFIKLLEAKNSLSVNNLKLKEW